MADERPRQVGPAVEPTQQAQDDYVRHFNEMQIDLSEFQRQCPPSYFNNEGDPNGKWALFRIYGPGWDAFQKMLRDWRDQGDLKGMVVESN